MSEHFFLYASVAVLTIRSFWEFAFFRGKVSPLLIYTLCYFYFCFGPYIAYILEIPIYSGIDKAELFQASIVFFLAISSLSIIPSNFISLISSRFEIEIRRPQFFQQITTLIMFIPILFIFAFAFIKIGFAPLNKVQRIQSIGLLHYVILTLWPLFLFCYMTITPFSKITTKAKKTIFIVVLTYFSYCYYMGERDFALLLIPLYFWICKDKNISMWKLLILVTVGAMLFTLMSAGRSEELSTSGLGSFLNQGSNLMVTTNIINWLENGTEKWAGMSYLSSFLNMISLGAIKLTPALSIWFSRKYSPYVNDGAYGFSIEGEVILNFGLIGVPIFFALVGIAISSAFKGYINNKPFGTLMTYFILFYFIYGIRGESLIIFKSFIYCCIIFFVLLFISQRGKFYLKY